MPGIGAARAAQIVAAVELGRRTLTRAGRERIQITSPRVLAEMLLPQYGSRAVEQFGVVLLDTKHRVLRTTVVTVGTARREHRPPARDLPRGGERRRRGASCCSTIIRRAIRSRARMTWLLTRRLVAAGVLMGIDVVDHVILADARYCSLREKGLL